MNAGQEVSTSALSTFTWNCNLVPFCIPRTTKGETGGSTVWKWLHDCSEAAHPARALAYAAPTPRATWEAGPGKSINKGARGPVAQAEVLPVCVPHAILSCAWCCMTDMTHDHLLWASDHLSLILCCSKMCIWHYFPVGTKFANSMSSFCPHNFILRYHIIKCVSNLNNWPYLILKHPLHQPYTTTQSSLLLPIKKLTKLPV